jgi:hypothetical protein
MSGMGLATRRRRLSESFPVGAVPGVIGPVFSVFSLWSGLSFIVEGRRYRPTGFSSRVTLPGIPRNVEGRVSSGLLPGAEKLLVDGQAYPTGWEATLGLRVLAMAPAPALLLGHPFFSLFPTWLAVSVNRAWSGPACPSESS